jgi:hypothetical protein
VKALALVVLLGSGIAAAQPNDDVKQAAALYDKGKRHFDIAEYAAAIAVWKEAYLLSSEPLLLFNIAQAHRLAGDCAQANRFYSNYKRVKPKPPNQAELDSAMAKCAGVEPATGDTTPLAQPVVEPVKPIEPVTPPPVEPTHPAEPEPKLDVVDQGRTLRLTGVGVASAGVLAGIIAIVYASRASSRADEVAALPPGTEWMKRHETLEEEGKDAQLRARVFGVIGVGALIGGGALYFYGRSKSAVHVNVAVTPSHSQLILSCAF